MILIIARFIQGIAIGGEYNNAGLLIVESTQYRPCFLSSILCATCQVGSLLALLMAIIVIKYKEIEHLWRVPFILGAAIGLINYKFRKKLEIDLQHNQLPIKFIDNMEDFHNLSKIILSGGLIGALIYLPITFTNLYATKYLKMSLDLGAYLTLISAIVYIISIPIIGFFSDKFDINKFMPIAALIATILIIPTYSLLVSGYLISFQIIATIIASIFNANIHVYIKELFPIEKRGRAVSFGFSIGGSTITIVN